MLLSNLWTWLLTALSPSSSYTNTNTSTLSTNTTATRPLMIAVEGNIASGKSTFLELLSKQHNVAVFPEPVARWTDVGGTNLFRDMCVAHSGENDLDGASPTKTDAFTPPFYTTM